MKTAPADVAELHAGYGQLTGRPEPLRFHEREWFELLRAPEYAGDAALLGADVALLVKYLRRMIAEEKRNPGCLKLRNFLQPDQFFADLAEAKAVKPSGRNQWSGTKPAGGAPMSEEEWNRNADTARQELARLKQKIGRPA